MILPCILKTIWWLNIIIWNYESVWPYVWPQNKCRSLWPIFRGQVILPYILKTNRCMKIIIWDYESVWPEVWPQIKYRSLWPIFHGPMILHYILKTIWCITSYFGIMGHTDPTFDLKINVGLSDLYFMVQWFYLISPRPFDAWVSYFQIMRQCDPNFDLKVNMSTWPIFHGLVILLNIFKIIWWMNIIVGVMVWHVDWPY